MKRAAILMAGLLVSVVATLVITQTGLGQQGPNPVCPVLRTDPFGFPLNPPYSEYPGGSGQTTIGVITVLKENLPCCGIIDANGNLVLVPADGVLERCIIPSIQVFFGETCPAMVDITLTVEASGVVRNCIPPAAAPPDTGGGSNFSLAGTNAN